MLYELRSYVDELEADPNRLEAVEDRLAALRALERKYGDVEGYLEEARTASDASRTWTRRPLGSRRGSQRGSGGSGTSRRG